MKKGKAIKLCIISQPFLAPFTHHKSLPSTPRDRTLMLKERCCLYILSNHVIFSFLINIVLISVSVQHEKSVQQKKMIFRLVMSSRQKKRVSAHSVLHIGAGGVIRRKQDVLEWKGMKLLLFLVVFSLNPYRVQLLKFCCVIKVKKVVL